MNKNIANIKKKIFYSHKTYFFEVWGKQHIYIVLCKYRTMPTKTISKWNAQILATKVFPKEKLIKLDNRRGQNFFSKVYCYLKTHWRCKLLIVFCTGSPYRRCPAVIHTVPSLDCWLTGAWYILHRLGFLVFSSFCMGQFSTNSSSLWLADPMECWLKPCRYLHKKRHIMIIRTAIIMAIILVILSYGSREGGGILIPWLHEFKAWKG
jgi:hypothetical protein